MEKKSITGLKKRQQIQNANRTMFLWIVAASVAVAICLVFGQFMLRQFMFNNKIIGAKNETYATLRDNKESFETLKSEVNKLVSNQSLSKLRVSDTDTALQVVVDALPTTDDRAALATSLQQVVLARSGVAVESINVIDAEGATTSEAEDGAAAGTSSDTVGEVIFTVVINGSYEQIQQALTDMEATIRPLSMQKVELEGSGSQLRATITAKSFYLPAKTAELKKETIKP